MGKHTVQGRIKSFDSEQGWGYIRSKDLPSEVIVNHSVVEGKGYQELVVGEEVEFRYEDSGDHRAMYRATWCAVNRFGAESNFGRKMVWAESNRIRRRGMYGSSGRSLRDPDTENSHPAKKSSSITRGQIRTDGGTGLRLSVRRLGDSGECG